MSKIFLTSGTGYIGHAVAKAAKLAGHEVTALARSDESAKRLQDAGIKPMRGDIRTSDSFRHSLKQFDVVIHTAATNDKDFSACDAQTVNTIVEELKGTNKVFIYTSGIWVMGNTVDKVATEETPTNPIALVAWRPPVERAALDGAKQGIRAIVIRPGIVYGGTGGIVGNMLAAAKDKGEVTYVGKGTNRWSLIHVDDLARLYLLAAEKAPAGSILHGTDNKPLQQHEVAQYVAKAAGVEGKVKSITPEEGKKAWGPFVDGLVLDQHIDSPVARKLLGWEPKAPGVFEDLKNCAKELAAQHK